MFAFSPLPTPDPRRKPPFFALHAFDTNNTTCRLTYGMKGPQHQENRKKQATLKLKHYIHGISKKVIAFSKAQ